MSDDRRQQLALLQAQVVRALVEGAEAPKDFDRARLAAAADALLSKRARAVAYVWPRLARAMRDEFAVRFADYARATPLPHDGSPLADGRAFLGWLAHAGLLTDEGRLEAFAFDARYRLRKGAFKRRRGLWLCAGRFGAARRLVILIRLPMIGERWLGSEIL